MPSSPQSPSHDPGPRPASPPPSAPASDRAGPAVGLGARLVAGLGDIKLAHSVFALPFALLAAVLAAGVPNADARRLAGQLSLVILCMVCARTWAMLVNRLADARFDAANPRTARRAFAAGRSTRRDGVLLLALAAVGFLAACAGFWIFFANPWPLALGVPVLLWVGFYSYTKRFTWWCHVFLGGALAASPLAAAVAVDPAALAQTPAIFWIAGMVLLWVAGFDVIYALQDLDFDRSAGLSSIPARFGWRRSAWISRALHAGALACLVAAGLGEPRFAVASGAGWLWWFGVVVVAATLVAEHAVLARRGRAGIPMAFFTLNGVVSLVLGTAGVAAAILARA